MTRYGQGLKEKRKLVTLLLVYDLNSDVMVVIMSGTKVFLVVVAFFFFILCF